MRLLVFLALSTIAVPVLAADPADPDLIPEARRVLDYLESIYGKKTLGGMSSYGGWRPVYEMTGRAPAIHGVDAFGWNKPKWGDSFRKVTRRAVDRTRTWWQTKGGIPQMQWHWGKPGDPRGSAWVRGRGGKGTGPVDVGATVTPGTPEHRAAMEDLEKTADYLAPLAEARVPVLWRPLHEIDGGWFWWTDKTEPEHTAALWRMIFDYFVKERKLHNLIWVYSAALRAGGLEKDASREAEIAFRRRYYPGPAYVDLAGIDIYPNSAAGWGPPTEDTYPRAFALMAEVCPGKRLALCEGAAIPHPDLLAAKGPPWLYSLPWFVGGANPPAWIRKTFTHEHIVTLDELPALVGHNVGPDVRIEAPADGAALHAGTVRVGVRAADRDGNLASVALRVLAGPWKNWALRDETDLAEALETAPAVGEARPGADAACTIAWPAPEAGFYSLVAVATDAEGARTLSNVARVTVGMTDLARGRPATASAKTDEAAQAVDGDLFTAWSGPKEGEPWIAVDSGAPAPVAAVAVTWWKAYAKAYRVEVSADSKTWHGVATVSAKRDRHGDTDLLRFAPREARHVRLVCFERGAPWGGYAVRDLRVYAEQ